jgi:dinuclear metal center YbgI/SA1388 family protein
MFNTASPLEGPTDQFFHSGGCGPGKNGECQRRGLKDPRLFNFRQRGETLNCRRVHRQGPFGLQKGVIVNPTISDIINIMETLAPAALAADWDNVGLQLGDPGRPVRAIWVALDPIEAVVKAACRQNVDLLVTHHPLIFKPLRSLNFSSPAGSIIDLAVRGNLAIFAAHTNLDSALGGINDILADRIGLKDLMPLVPAGEHRSFKIVIHTPRGLAQQISRVLLGPRGESGSQLIQGSSAMPVNGINLNRNTDEILYEAQTRLEIEVCSGMLSSVVRTLTEFQNSHRIRFNIAPLVSPEHKSGIGRVGALESELDLKSLALMVKKNLQLPYLKFAGDPELSVKKVAICSGSGAGLLENFFDSGAEVYISGDLRYHDARDAEGAGLGLVDIGHFSSEHLIVEVLADRLAGILSESKLDASVKACDIEKEPFVILQ